ncbi:uncharacterized protein YndB with AHSA1/START domain [Haloactinopolyspora alba]|uniref:Uncharacterized protein YndB with AHSA1/START domain n=1 Tax=Haloactinopolyspora alba TaxID=648780 RepID=A0A2P8DY49_9ACTN|nr:SRPBCC family protein [Haloactinopolyspora alba]PSL02150.1 uncharacterized protein YndB with AHSA1/START domain [Haloactinopolyspora alba]
MTETLSTEGGRNVLRIERRLAHPQEKVWRAITRPDHLSRWFPATVEFDLVTGAEVSFDMDGEGTMSADGTVTVVDPPRRFAFTWHGEVLDWELHPEGDGCLLVFRHTFDDRAGAASFCSGWLRCLDALDDVVGDTPVTHRAPSPELHDHYVDRFGLDEPAVVDDGDKWRVRVERQLIRPAEDAWALLDTGDGDVPGGFTHDRLTAGALVRQEPARVLEFDWSAGEHTAGRVRWEFTTGTGHGARLVVTQTGPAALPGERDTAVRAWPQRVARLAEQLRSTAARYDE